MNDTVRAKSSAPFAHTFQKRTPFSPTAKPTDSHSLDIVVLVHATCVQNSWYTLTMQTIVGVLRGGASREHDVSLKTGAAMLKHLPKDRFEAHDICIDKEGQWHDR